jgi:SRSO17 transposase
VFKTKTELATEMVAGAVTAGAPFGWAAGDEVYGRSWRVQRRPADPGRDRHGQDQRPRSPLLNLAATPMTTAARQLGYAWSRWRRAHQARARYHHYQARLPPVPI